MARIPVFKNLKMGLNLFNALVILGFKYHMGNIFRYSHILQTYLTSFYAREIAAKYGKRRKIDLIVRVNVR